MVCASARRPADLFPGAAAEMTSPPLPSPAVPAKISGLPSPQSPQREEAVEFRKAVDVSSGNLLLTSAQQPAKDTGQPKKLINAEERLFFQLMAVPGAEVPPIKLPHPTEQPKEFKAAVQKYFPPPPPLGPEPQPQPGPNGRPLTLADLQELGRANSPLLRQAGADVAAAQGAAKQAGAYANPTFGLQSTSPSNSGGPTYGVVLGQTITTMGKKKLAQAAAVMDLENAQIAFRRAETDLMASIRTSYFGVLVALEGIKANRALVKLTDEVYKVQVDYSLAGEAAVYESMQMAVFAAQARQALIVAENNYALAWKQLAARIGIFDMPPTALEGRIDIIPSYDDNKVLTYVLTRHTEMAAAGVSQNKARYNLRLAEVTAVPDVTVQATLSNDATFGVNNRLVAGLQATVPVPVWDLNRGAIQQAQGALLRAVEEQHRVRDDLTQRVADALRRYHENSKLLEIFRQDILPKQVQAFRAVVTRHYRGETRVVGFTDLITSEQNLVAVIGPYIAALGAQWQAVVDVASLLQTDDLFQANGVFPAGPVCDLEKLLQLPCCHPCSPFPTSVFPGVERADAPDGAAVVIPRLGMPRLAEPEATRN
jgi:cobalt-zinc-cadmium efflux system outer membrane protein